MGNRKTAALVLALILLPTVAHGARWTAVPASSEVVFTSHAPLETFKGRTHGVTGWVDFDPDNLMGPLAWEISVDLASLDTGKKKRNRHMRENHLETDRFPAAVFRGTEVVSCSFGVLAPGAGARVRVRGVFDLHGVVRPLECDVALSRDGAGNVTIDVGFPVLLSDHAIKRPKFLVMKLADEQQVAVRLVLRRETAP